ncbi:MAG: hypothetical protein G01um101470_576 [Parcubacteria group bacterium Gr01-1014_70]|nr:MAG: hypothetical protein G01um101470_576 [Parcubacteria group bacterium Gr01-1014_70]
MYAKERAALFQIHRVRAPRTVVHTKISRLKHVAVATSRRIQIRTVVWMCQQTTRGVLVAINNI